ncbi:XdhC family protein [Halobaculum marinum]|uniref:XdhC family protein n=1 Tax=Halobaculum marinum TaxID=3031996 RepID=A0ABD5WWH6_9EURY|nr:XdhC family protein [Halobaculum sp. DT55]
MTRDTEEDPSTTPERPADADGDVSDVERELASAGEPYARVTVVRREPPVSANVGDRAVVTREGDLRGWIGGAACAQTTAITEALAAIEDGQPRLIGIAPDPETVARPGLEAFPMTCHSEGVLELFVEPVNPRPELVICGGSPVARSLARLATELAVDVVVVDPTGDETGLPEGTRVLTDTDPEALANALGHDPLVVVATMGSFDASGVAAGVLADARYVGLIASSKRADEVVDTAAALIDRDPEDVAARVTNPAGVDVAAYTPAEIAVSIVAEVVDHRRGRGDAPRVAAATSTSEEPTAADATEDHGTDAADTASADGDTDPGGDEEVPAEAIDPVCGMTVDPSDTAHSVAHDGETYYFCCGGCAESFRADPASYLAEDDAPT